MSDTLPPDGPEGEDEEGAGAQATAALATGSI